MPKDLKSGRFLPRDTFGDRTMGDDRLAREVHDPDAVPTENWDTFASSQFPDEGATPTPDHATRVRGSSRMTG